MTLPFRLSAPVALLALASLLVTSCMGAHTKARDFALDDLDGHAFQLSEHVAGRAVLITFWSTSCHECQWQMPIFSALHHDYAARGLTVVAIATDGPRSRAEVRALATNAGIDFPVLLDEATSVLALYNPRKSVPTTVLVGPDGLVRMRLHDFYLTGKDPALVSAIEKALADARGPVAQTGSQ